jgi:hypothetical protein
VLRALVLAAAASLLAACGSTATQTVEPRAKQCPAARRALAGLEADIASIRRAARTQPEESPQVNAATDRFLRHVALAPIGNLRRNRLIDHAMGALSGSCEQCFQALEAARPIVSIRYGSAGACR